MGARIGRLVPVPCIRPPFLIATYPPAFAIYHPFGAGRLARPVHRVRVHFQFQSHHDGQQPLGPGQPRIAVVVPPQRGKQGPQRRQQRLVQVGQAQPERVGAKDVLAAGAGRPARVLQVLVIVVDDRQAGRRRYPQPRPPVFPKGLRVRQQHFHAPGDRPRQRRQFRHRAGLAAQRAWLAGGVRVQRQQRLQQG